MEDEFDVRHEALSRCLQKLNDRDRRMVLTVMSRVKCVCRGTSLCRTVQGAYKALNRIRKLLFDCVSFELTAEQTQAR